MGEGRKREKEGARRNEERGAWRETRGRERQASCEGGREGDWKGGGAVRVGRDRGRGGPRCGEGIAEAECREPAGLAPKRAR